MSRYKTYAEYKNSGVEWLESAPKHWQVFQGKRIFGNYREQALENDEQLAASQKFGVVPQTLMMELNDSKVMLALKGTSSFRHVDKDDFVISLRSFEGGIEHSAYNGCVSPAYTVLRATKNICADYYRHLFKSRPYISALQATTDSLRDGKSISFDQFGAIELVLPPRPEQEKIANFLDHETAKIDTLIVKQQDLIKLLKEKRQAVISHAVTKGLNPNAPMRDSGVAWLGEVPAHWKVSPIKWYASIKSGENLSANEIESIKDEKFCYPVYGGNGVLGYSKNFNLKNSSIIIGRVGALCGNVHKVKDLSWISDNALVLNIDISVLNLDYISLCLGARDLNKLADKNAQPLITGTKVMNESVPIPLIDEQREIADRVSVMMKQFEMLSFQAESGIALLQERRIALISAAVTGQIDLRSEKTVVVEEFI